MNSRLRTIAAYLQLLIALAVTVRNIAGGCPPIPASTAEIEVSSTLSTGMIVYTCVANMMFTTGEIAIVKYCVDGDWQEMTTLCGTGPPVCDSSSVTAFIPPADSVEETLTFVTTTSEITSKIKQYKCLEGKGWLSGEPSRITQCRGDAWDPILDVCEEACTVPRDCHDVQQLGFTLTDSYLVVPSGNSLDSTVKVWCELDITGGSWTSIFYNSAQAMIDDTSKYDTGFTLPDDDGVAPRTAYFIGLEYLHQLTKKLDGSPRPHVLEVLISDGSVNKTATYSSLIVESATEAYALSSLGTYYGNAGDGLCPHAHSSFTKNTENIGWWGDGSTRADLITAEKGSELTGATMLWVPLNTDPSAFAITAAWMRIRPADVDAAISCPPSFGLEPYWTNTKGIFINSRAEGSTAIYTCSGTYVTEDLTGVKAATVTCITDTNSNAEQYLRWEPSITLPCLMKCPTDFVPNSDQTSCLFFSQDSATGLIDATNKCNAKGASVAKLTNADNLENAEAGFIYYTAHNVLATAVVYPDMTVPLDTATSGLTCVPATDATDCTPATPTECITVKSDFNFEVAACKTDNVDARYMCERPAYCPTGFDKVSATNGACYGAVIGVTTTLQAGEEGCNLIGGTLAYPITVQQLQDIKNTMIILPGDAGNTYLIGTNFVDPTGTNFGTFPTLEAQLLTDLQHDTLTDPYRVLIATETEITVGAWTWESSTATNAICQPTLPTGCPADEPNALDFMTKAMDITTHAFMDAATYR